jgi:hypothetical protein
MTELDRAILEAAMNLFRKEASESGLSKEYIDFITMKSYIVELNILIMVTNQMEQTSPEFSYN